MRKELYNHNDDGNRGKTFERDLKVKLDKADELSAAGKIDLRYSRKCIECKTGSGELGEVGSKMLKGNSLVIYVPVVDMDAPVEKQEGFVLSRDKFLEILSELELIRTKTSTKGKLIYSIQTIWNHKQNKPHSKKKYEALLDALYENCICTLEEWVQGLK